MGGGKELPDIRNDEKFVPTNWKQLSKKELQKLSLIEQSRYLAYEPPSNSTGINKCKQRLQENIILKKDIERQRLVENMKLKEDRLQNAVVGELKAAEALRRDQLLRSKCRSNKTEEINRLISSQSTAIKAVRLQSLLPPIRTKITFVDPMKKKQRMRVEALMEDNIGLETARILN